MPALFRWFYNLQNWNKSQVIYLDQQLLIKATEHSNQMNK